MRFGIVLALSVAAVGGLVLLLLADRPSPDAHGSAAPLRFYCAAGIHAPVQATLDEYRQRYGVEFETRFEGSGALLHQMRIDPADLYLAADIQYLQQGRADGLIAEILPLARQKPVVVVAAGNPKSITSLSDLLRDDVTLTLAEPKAAAIGKMVQKLLGDERWGKLWSKCKIQRSTVEQVALDVQAGGADAGIVWDQTSARYNNLQAVPLPQLDEGESLICIGIGAKTAQPTAALRFARYLAAADRGLEHFRTGGFRPVQGDQWAEVPELVLYCGGLMRPGVEAAVRDFETREGVRVITSYKGCGELVSGMRAGERPDVYFACDTTFLDKVQDLFLDSADVSRTEMVLIAPKGNPADIRSLEDLARPGVKIALADPQKSALGELTDRLLQRRGLLEKVRGNVHATAATADSLVQFVVVGQLDAAVVYRANTTRQFDKLEVYPLDDPDAAAVQPIAVGRESKFPLLAGRLKARLTSPQTAEDFTSLGFGWLVEESP